MAILTSRFDFRAVLWAGVAAGLSLVLFEVLATAYLTGAHTAGQPLRAIAALVIGSRVFDPKYPMAFADATGVTVDLLLSIAFAGVFAAIVSGIVASTEGELLTTTAGLVLAGMFFGTVLWLGNYYVVGRIAGWTWLPGSMNRDVAFLGHAFFFGAPLGWMLGHMRRGRARRESGGTAKV